MLHTFLGQKELVALQIFWDLGWSLVMSTVDTQETNVQLARDDLTVIMTMVASLRFKKNTIVGRRVSYWDQGHHISLWEVTREMLPWVAVIRHGWKFATCELWSSQDRMRLREVRPEHIATSCNRVQVVVFLCQCARVSLEKACGCFIGQSVIWPHTIGQVCFLLQITSPASQGCHFQRSLIGQLLKGTLAPVTIL